MVNFKRIILDTLPQKNIEWALKSGDLDEYIIYQSVVQSHVIAYKVMTSKLTRVK